MPSLTVALPGDIFVVLLNETEPDNLRNSNLFSKRSLFIIIYHGKQLHTQIERKQNAIRS